MWLQHAPSDAALEATVRTAGSGAGGGDGNGNGVVKLRPARTDAGPQKTVSGDLLRASEAERDRRAMHVLEWRVGPDSTRACFDGLPRAPNDAGEPLLLEDGLPVLVAVSLEPDAPRPLELEASVQVQLSEPGEPDEPGPSARARLDAAALGLVRPEECAAVALPGLRAQAAARFFSPREALEAAGPGGRVDPEPPASSVGLEARRQLRRLRLLFDACARRELQAGGYFERPTALAMRPAAPSVNARPALGPAFAMAAVGVDGENTRKRAASQTSPGSPSGSPSGLGSGTEGGSEAGPSEPPEQPPATPARDPASQAPATPGAPSRPYATPSKKSRWEAAESLEALQRERDVLAALERQALQDARAQNVELQRALERARARVEELEASVAKDAEDANKMAFDASEKVDEAQETADNAKAAADEAQAAAAQAQQSADQASAAATVNERQLAEDRQTVKDAMARSQTQNQAQNEAQTQLEARLQAALAELQQQFSALLQQAVRQEQQVQQTQQTQQAQQEETVGLRELLQTTAAAIERLDACCTELKTKDEQRRLGLQQLQQDLAQCCVDLERRLQEAADASLEGLTGEARETALEARRRRESMSAQARIIEEQAEELEARERLERANEKLARALEREKAREAERVAEALPAQFGAAPVSQQLTDWESFGSAAQNAERAQSVPAELSDVASQLLQELKRFRDADALPLITCVEPDPRTPDAVKAAEDEDARLDRALRDLEALRGAFKGLDLARRELRLREEQREATAGGAQLMDDDDRASATAAASAALRDARDKAAETIELALDALPEALRLIPGSAEHRAEKKDADAYRRWQESLREALNALCSVDALLPPQDDDSDAARTRALKGIQAQAAQFRDARQAFSPELANLVLFLAVTRVPEEPLSLDELLELVDLELEDPEAKRRATAPVLREGKREQDEALQVALNASKRYKPKRQPSSWDAWVFFNSDRLEVAAFLVAGYARKREEQRAAVAECERLAGLGREVFSNLAEALKGVFGAAGAAVGPRVDAALQPLKRWSERVPPRGSTDSQAAFLRETTEAAPAALKRATTALLIETELLEKLKDDLGSTASKFAPGPSESPAGQAAAAQAAEIGAPREPLPSAEALRTLATAIRERADALGSNGDMGVELSQRRERALAQLPGLFEAAGDAQQAEADTALDAAKNASFKLQEALKGLVDSEDPASVVKGLQESLKKLAPRFEQKALVDTIAGLEADLEDLANSTYLEDRLEADPALEALRRAVEAALRRVEDCLQLRARLPVGWAGARVAVALTLDVDNFPNALPGELPGSGLRADAAVVLGALQQLSRETREPPRVAEIDEFDGPEKEPGEEPGEEPVENASEDPAGRRCGRLLGALAGRARQLRAVRAALKLALREFFRAMDAARDEARRARELAERAATRKAAELRAQDYLTRSQRGEQLATQILDKHKEMERLRAEFAADRQDFASRTVEGGAFHTNAKDLVKTAEAQADAFQAALQRAYPSLRWLGAEAGLIPPQSNADLRPRLTGRAEGPPRFKELVAELQQLAKAPYSKRLGALLTTLSARQEQAQTRRDSTLAYEPVTGAGAAAGSSNEEPGDSMQTWAHSNLERRRAQRQLEVQLPMLHERAVEQAARANEASDQSRVAVLRAEKRLANTRLRRARAVEMLAQRADDFGATRADIERSEEQLVFAGRQRAGPTASLEDAATRCEEARRAAAAASRAWDALAPEAAQLLDGDALPRALRTRSPRAAFLWALLGGGAGAARALGLDDPAAAPAAQLKVRLRLCSGATLKLHATRAPARAVAANVNAPEAPANLQLRAQIEPSGLPSDPNALEALATKHAEAMKRETARLARDACEAVDRCLDFVQIARVQALDGQRTQELAPDELSDADSQTLFGQLDARLERSPAAAAVAQPASQPASQPVFVESPLLAPRVQALQPSARAAGASALQRTLHEQLVEDIRLARAAASRLRVRAWPLCALYRLHDSAPEQWPGGSPFLNDASPWEDVEARVLGPGAAHARRGPGARALPSALAASLRRAARDPQAPESAAPAPYDRAAQAWRLGAPDGLDAAAAAAAADFFRAELQRARTEAVEEAQLGPGALDDERGLVAFEVAYGPLAGARAAEQLRRAAAFLRHWLRPSESARLLLDEAAQESKDSRPLEAPAALLCNDPLFCSPAGSLARALLAESGFWPQGPLDPRAIAPEGLETGARFAAWGSDARAAAARLLGAAGAVAGALEAQPLAVRRLPFTVAQLSCLTDGMRDAEALSSRRPLLNLQDALHGLAGSAAAPHKEPLGAAARWIWEARSPGLRARALRVVQGLWRAQAAAQDALAALRRDGTGCDGGFAALAAAAFYAAAPLVDNDGALRYGLGFRQAEQLGWLASARLFERVGELPSNPRPPPTPAPLWEARELRGSLRTRGPLRFRAVLGASPLRSDGRRLDALEASVSARAVQRALERLALSAERAGPLQEAEQREAPQEPEESEEEPIAVLAPGQCLFCSPGSSAAAIKRLFGTQAYSDDSPELLRVGREQGAGPRVLLGRPKLAPGQAAWDTPRDGVEALERAIALESGSAPENIAAAANAARAEEDARTLAWNAERMAQLGSLALWLRPAAAVEVQLPPQAWGAFQEPGAADALNAALQIDAHLLCAAALGEALGQAWGVLPDAALRPRARGPQALRARLGKLVRLRAACFKRLAERGVDVPLVECARVCGLVCPQF